jgi:hypothetical protein
MAASFQSFRSLINAVKYRREDPVDVQVTAGLRGTDWIIRLADNGLP